MVTQFQGVKYDVCKEAGVNELMDQAAANEEAANTGESATTADLANDGSSEGEAVA